VLVVPLNDEKMAPRASDTSIFSVNPRLPFEALPCPARFSKRTKMLRCSRQLGLLWQHGHPKQAAAWLAGLAHLLHDSAATSKTCVGAADGRSSSSTWDLYSMNTSEVQQQAYLQAAAAAQQVAEEAASAGGEQLSHDDRVEVSCMLAANGCSSARIACQPNSRFLPSGGQEGCRRAGSRGN
jgi:hypothetical protein